jgi:hypothetical protein
MSDGVWKYVGWDHVRDTALRLHGAELVSASQRLARLPTTGQFQDDFTMVVLEENPSVEL